MTRQSPDFTVPPADPRAWVTTGTPETGPRSSDLKTVEMNATIERLVSEYGATKIATVGPAYAGQLLLPDGTLTYDYSIILPWGANWQREIFARQVRAKAFLILYWCGMATQTVWACEEDLALAVHDAQVALQQGTGSQAAVDAAYAAIKAAAEAREAPLVPFSEVSSLEVQVKTLADRVTAIEQELGLEAPK